MTTKEASEKLGMMAIVELNGMHIDMRVIDHKISYGQDKFLLKPIAGRSTAWFKTSSIIGFELQRKERIYSDSSGGYRV